MRMLCGRRWPGLLAMLFLIQTPAATRAAGPEADDQTAGGMVEVKKVKYDALIDIIKQFKGKVVVVDFWQTT